MKILTLCLITLITHRNNDLRVFINSINGRVIYVNSYRALSDQVKQEFVSECPELVLPLFSGKGKRISANAYSKYEFYKFSPDQRFGWKNNIVCVLVHNDLIIWDKDFRSCF